MKELGSFKSIKFLFCKKLYTLALHLALVLKTLVLNP